MNHIYTVGLIVEVLIIFANKIQFTKSVSDMYTNETTHFLFLKKTQEPELVFTGLCVACT